MTGSMPSACALAVRLLVDQGMLAWLSAFGSTRPARPQRAKLRSSVETGFGRSGRAQLVSIVASIVMTRRPTEATA